MTIWELKKTAESKVTTAGGVGGGSSYQIPPLLIVDPLRYELAYSSMVVLAISAGTLLTQQPHLILSGGKEDLGALAMLEDNVKKRVREIHLGRHWVRPRLIAHLIFSLIGCLSRVGLSPFRARNTQSFEISWIRSGWGGFSERVHRW